MTRLGAKQVEKLRIFRPGSFAVVGDAHLRRLAALGLVKAHGPDGDSFYGITSAGLRALADAADAGRLDLGVSPAMLPKERP
jgi:hypothetical protein